MKKNKLHTYIIFITALFILGSYFIFIKNGNVSVNNKITTEEIVPQNDIAENTVTLTVQGKTYVVKIKNGSSVYDAMNTLENTEGSNFTFHSNKYSSLGNFIDEINGVKGTPGKYWIYYINGKEASIGVSVYVLKSGDVISWKQEAL